MGFSLGAEIRASYFAGRTFGGRICCLTNWGHALLRPKVIAPRFHRIAADAPGHRPASGQSLQFCKVEIQRFPLE